MCALHPDMRSDWAAAWSRFLKPGGTLACLVFPVDPERQTGPPWPVTPDIYEDLLSKHGESAKAFDEVELALTRDLTRLHFDIVLAPQRGRLR